MGTIGTFKDHMETCEFAMVPCPKKCRVSYVSLRRRDLDKHLENCPLRDYTCQHCGEKGTFAGITGIHDMTCEKKILPCSNAECTQTMERQQMDEHVLTQCPHTVISCKYKGIGCDKESKRKDMAAHEKADNLHLHMALDAVNTLQGIIQEKTVTLRGSESMTFAVPGYKEKTDAYEFDFTSPSFYTNGYHMEVAVFFHGIVMYFRTHILKGRYDNVLKWPFVGNVSIKLLNQLEDKNHYICMTRATENGDITNTDMPTGVVRLYHHELAFDRNENTQYLVDDTLYFRVSVEVADRKPWLQCTAK